MTRLTEALLTKGKRNHSDIRKFVFGKPTYHHREIVRPPVLGNKVSEAKRNVKGAVCLDLLQQMLSCWKRNDFKEGTCQDEYIKYAACVDEHLKIAQQKKKMSDTDVLGDTTTNVFGIKTINSKQANKLLRMFPQPDYEVKITHGLNKKLSKPDVYTQKKKV